LMICNLSASTALCSLDLPGGAWTNQMRCETAGPAGPDGACRQLRELNLSAYLRAYSDADMWLLLAG
jgi:hypothetical protein